MYDIRLEKAKLVALQASLKRFAVERSGLAPDNLGRALLVCKEEDTRLEIATVEFGIARQENEIEGLRNRPPPTVICGTCKGWGFVDAPRGNHSWTPERVPCPDCIPKGVTATQ